MSQYSGKCDCFDHFWMKAETEEDVQKEIDRTNFYMWIKDRRIKLDIHTVKDLVPYYPFLISMGVWSKDERCTVVFSKESFVDQEEREWIGWHLRDALAEYKKCKRKKIPFDPQAYLKNVWWTPANYDEEIVRRVAQDGLKANIEGLFSTTKDKWERIPLAQEMKRYGYDDHFIEEWVFGWRKKEEIPEWREEKLNEETVCD